MKKSLIAVTALLGVVFLTSNAFSWGHGNGYKRGGYGGGCGGGYNAMSSLTDEQKTQLSDLRQKFIDETYEARSAMMDKHQAIQMLLETSAPDKAKLETLSNEIMALKKTMHDKRIDYILAAKKIAPELNADAFRHHGGGFGKGGGRGAGPCGASQGGGQPCIQ